MKKLLFALLACAALFSFAACSNDDEEQDVNIVSYDEKTFYYYCSVQGTFTPKNGTAVTIQDTSGYVRSYNDGNTNTKRYRFAANYVYFTLSGETSVTKASTGTIAVYKSDGKYYVYNDDNLLTDVTSRFTTGDPTAKTFTYVYDTTLDGTEGTLSLTFTRL